MKTEDKGSYTPWRIISLLLKEMFSLNSIIRHFVFFIYCIIGMSLSVGSAIIAFSGTVLLITIYCDNDCWLKCHRNILAYSMFFIYMFMTADYLVSKVKKSRLGPYLWPIMKPPFAYLRKQWGKNPKGNRSSHT